MLDSMMAYPTRSESGAMRRLLPVLVSLTLACGGRGTQSSRETPDDTTLPSEAASPGATLATLPTSTTAAGVAAADATTTSAGGSVNGCSRDAEDYIIRGSSELCTARELPECADGSQSFLDSCGCGCTSVPNFPRACRLGCTDADHCTMSPFEDVPDFSDTLSAWQSDFENSPLFQYGGFLLEGVCASGRRFLYRSDHYSWETNVFNAAGAFLALVRLSDASDELCGSSHYFPEPPRCAGATITHVWQQDTLSHFKEGDPVELDVLQ
jgi:hypothetical protein